MANVANSLQEAQAENGGDLEWSKYLTQAIAETNEDDIQTTKKSGFGMMSSSPDDATTGPSAPLIQFELKKASAQGYQHGS